MLYVERCELRLDNLHCLGDALGLLNAPFGVDLDLFQLLRCRHLVGDGVGDGIGILDKTSLDFHSAEGNAASVGTSATFVRLVFDLVWPS